MKIDINLILHEAITTHQEGKLEEAEQLYQKILKIDPKNIDAHNNLGSALYQLNRLDESEISYKKAIELNPDFAEGYNNLGAVLNKQGRFDESEKSYKKAINLKPDYAESYNNLGNVLKHHSRFDGAEVNYIKAIELKPNYTEAYYNLGILYYELSKFELAETYYKKAIEIKPDYAEAHSNLGNALNRLNRLQEAKASYKKAIEFKIDYEESHNNLGQTLYKLGKLDEAEVSFRKAIKFKPDYIEAHNNLGNTLKDLTRFDEAIISYKKTLELNSDYSEAKHFLSALTEKTTQTAPRKYVENLFDNYALNFENSLINNLDYKIPKMITEMILRDNSNILIGSVLDIGCGTGLIGNEIKQHCSKLEGIDVSKAMLKQAKVKNVYDKLKHQEIIEYLLTEDLDFDYFVSADVFIYIGELTEIFRLIKSRNNSKGKFIFSTEHTDKDGFVLEKTGRYSHSKKYIENLCSKFNYKLSCYEEIDLRKEKKKPIKGALYLLDF